MKQVDNRSQASSVFRLSVLHQQSNYTLHLFFQLYDKQKPVFYIVAAYVKALYPNLYRDTVTKALECALEKHSDNSAEARKIIVELNKICLNNVVTQYGNQLYIKKTES